MGKRYLYLILEAVSYTHLNQKGGVGKTTTTVNVGIGQTGEMIYSVDGKEVAKISEQAMTALSLVFPVQNS